MQRREFEKTCEQKLRMLVLAVEVKTTGLIDRGLPSTKDAARRLILGRSRKEARSTIRVSPRSRVLAPTWGNRGAIRGPLHSLTCCPGSLAHPPSSCRGAVVVVQSAEHGDRYDRAGERAWRAFTGYRNPLADPLVRSSRVEVAQGVFSEDVP